jgi:hypothetical protein
MGVLYGRACMLARTDFWDRSEFNRSTKERFLDFLKNPDFLAIFLFSALGLVITICLASAFPVTLNDTISLIGQFD